MKNDPTKPTAVVSPEIAEAFGMEGLPNTIVKSPAPMRHEFRASLERLKTLKQEGRLLKPVWANDPSAHGDLKTTSQQEREALLAETARETEWFRPDDLNPPDKEAL